MQRLKRGRYLTDERFCGALGRDELAWQVAGFHELGLQNASKAGVGEAFQDSMVGSLRFKLVAIEITGSNCKSDTAGPIRVLSSQVSGGGHQPAVKRRSG